MSYTTHRSLAIVIAHTTHGASDRIITLLTEDHGVIRARVQNGRGIESRLRYGIQFLTRGIFEYIRAHDTWRLIGIHHIENSTLTPEQTQRCALICRDLVHFVQGEDPCPEIYDVVVNILTESTADFTHHIAEARLTILALLGYIEGDPIEIAQDPSRTRRVIQEAYTVAQM